MAVGAQRLTENMFMAAAEALATMSPARQDRSAGLLPGVDKLRQVAVVVARAVARQAQADAVADPMSEDEIERCIRAQLWKPVYRPYQKRVARRAEALGAS